jgi:hypothetical protein
MSLVKKAAALLLLAAAVCAHAETDWRDSLTPPTPGYFPMPAPVKLCYRMGWAGIPAGEATVWFHSGTDGRIEMDATGRSTGAARALWRLDATHKAVADAASLMPQTVHQVEDYGWKMFTTDMEFEDGGVWRQVYNKPYDPAPPPRKFFKLPSVRDMHTAILFIRSQRCAPGDTYTMVVCPGSGNYLVRAAVLGRERLAVRAGKFDAIKFELKIQGIDRHRELVPFKKCKRVFIWVSNDANRYLLRITGELFIGSVWAELQSVRLLDK